MLTDRARAVWEARLQAAFAAVMAARAAELLRLLGVPPDIKRVPLSYWSALDASLTAALEPLLTAMATESALGLGAQAGISSAVNWALVNSRAASWASRYTFDLVSGIDATTQTMLQDTISSFFKTASVDLRTLSGQIQVPELVNKLGQVITSETRANMIAVTEVTRAASQGEQALLTEIRRQNPNVRVTTIWLTSRDEIVCPICLPRNGKRQGDGWTEPPPAHPRCRCIASVLIAGLPNPGGL